MGKLGVGAQLVSHRIQQRGNRDAVVRCERFPTGIGSIADKTAYKMASGIMLIERKFDTLEVLAPFLAAAFFHGELRLSAARRAAKVANGASRALPVRRETAWLLAGWQAPLRFQLPPLRTGA